MRNIKKISQVLLIAGAFIFASFYGLQVQAQDAVEAAINEDAPIAIDSVAVVATSSKNSEKQTSKTNTAISDEETKQAADIAKDIENRQKLADDASAAEKAYENSVKEYKEAANTLAEKQRAVASAQAACQRDENSEECQALEEAQQKAQQAEGDLAKKKIAADKAYKEKYAKEKLANEANASATSIIKNSEEALSQAKQKVKDKENEISNLETTLKEATAACEHSKTLTSRQGKADAEKYCGMQTQVEEQLATAKEELAEAEEELAIAQADYESYHPLETEHKGQEYKAFSTATGEIFQGTYSGSIDYSNTGDVFSTITRRAARILVGLKPIVYVFAGFGLIAFAFMAIFNKISWKWFANIAIGLFLVANMGRLIEYMVYTVDDRDLAAAEKPSEFGDHLHVAFADTEYAWVDVVTPYMPPEIVETPDTSVQPPAEDEKESNVRGFCEAEQKGGGLFGGGGFASCVKDLISAGKKAVDTAKKVQNTVDTVKNTVDSVKYASQNIGAAIDKIGEGNLEDSFNALSQIGKNVNYIVGSTGGMMDNVMSNTIDIANNVQDISKSRDEQAELQARRDKGEATGGFTAALMGQTVTRDEDGKVTGVEHRWGGNLEYDEDGNVVVKSSGFDDKGNAVEGDIASNKKEQVLRDKNGKPILDKDGNKVTGFNNTGQLGFMDITNDVVQKSGQLNQKFNEASQTAGALTGAVANFSAFGSKSINEGRQERQAEKKAKALAQKNAERAEADKNRISATSSSAGGENPVVAAQTAANDYKSIKSEAATAENTAQRLDKEAKSAAQKAEQLAEKASKTGLEADKIAAEAAQKEAERTQRKANEAKETAASLKEQAAEAEKKATETAIKATESVRDQAKEEMESMSKRVEAAKKDLEEAEASGDAERVKKAKEELSTQQNKYDKAEQSYYEAATEYATLTENKDARESAEQKLADEKTAAEIVKKYEEQSNPVTIATTAQNELRQAETEATRAQGDAKNKQIAAEKAQKEAEEAQKKADKTGLASDKEAAKLAEAKANQAVAASQEAQKKAEEAQAAIAPLEEKVHEALVNQADYLEKKAEADVEKYAESIKEAKANVSKIEDELAAAQTAAQEAARKAAETKNPSDIVAAQKAAENAKKKEKELNDAEKKLAEENRNYNNAYIGQYEAKAEKADLTEETKAKQEAYQSGVNEKNQEKRKQEAEEIRQQYAQATNPVVAAQTAEDKLAAARKKAQEAENNAASKDRIAKTAAAAAAEAAAIAQKTGDPADQRRANELQRRAELAAQDASEAQEVAQQTQEPLKELEEYARQANIEAAVYNQKNYKKELVDVEKNVSQYRNDVGAAQKNVDAAYSEAQAKIAAAQADPDNDNAVIAAKRAYDEYVKQQQELTKTQKKLEEEIKRRNEVEREYDEAYEKEQELKGK